MTLAWTKKFLPMMSKFHKYDNRFQSLDTQLSTRNALAYKPPSRLQASPNTSHPKVMKNIYKPWAYILAFTVLHMQFRLKRLMRANYSGVYGRYTIEWNLRTSTPNWSPIIDDHFKRIYFLIFTYSIFLDVWFIKKKLAT